jgi:hypothetical protein
MRRVSAVTRRQDVARIEAEVHAAQAAEAADHQPRAHKATARRSRPRKAGGCDGAHAGADLRAVLQPSGCRCAILEGGRKAADDRGGSDTRR